ncbi:nucleosome assembly protein 1-like 4 [Scaptodrosophila lebanonensis]|uniref:Nucleosome assembly protein 1-like 4 n=1 Tax=Drosophila lebanonensis TaxID=7225 RepID=A0A6J2TQQ2_DROLE|nr:nucleosome assembly protein 1-like 4 [Scaptodrosophila lebanonensis]
MYAVGSNSNMTNAAFNSSAADADAVVHANKKGNGEQNDESNDNINGVDNESMCNELGDLIMCPADMPANSRKAFLQHMVENLPPTVQNRVLALKHNQMQQIKISEEFFREVYALEQRFYHKSCELFDERRDIIGGVAEPQPQERYWNEEHDPMLEEIRSSEEFKQLTSQLQRMPDTVQGVPKFWLTVFRNVALISDMVQEHDEPLLEYLQDIRISYEPDSYTIEFHFEPNDYLHTSSLVLTKRYILRHEADKMYPFMFEGPEIVSCEGCKIHWRDGANLTLQTVECRRLRKGGRCIPKVMPRDSFFRFFSPPPSVDLSMADEKTKMVLGTDFEVGYLLRTQIVPKAILFYTGDIVDSINDDLGVDVTSVSSDSQDLVADRPSTSSSIRK